MATPSSTPFYGSSTLQGTGMTPVTSSTQRVALDNIIRRELKVGDPNDPKQVAEALLTRYKDTPRAQAISQEAKGLPFLLSAPAMPAVVQAPTSSDAELQQAKDDVDRDLQELTTNSLLKDVTPELQGWAQGVRSAIQEGTVAARFALDPRQRDKAFAIRRQLGDYARMARLVGALTPTLSVTYRKFAQSLDEVAAVILVTMGESLANVGFNGGRFLLQAPYSELQSRRDAAIYALRNLIGATQEAYAPNEWPRGLDAYRRLFDLLEKQGQGDLRALLVEQELVRTMDELIQRAAHGRVEGLRALGSTAQLDLERFRRMVIIGQRVVKPESPPLTSFLEALQLFTDAFESSGGFRLTRIARPPILFYGLYGTTTLEDADRRLLDLIILRGLLADELDCFLQCGCSPENIRCQIVLDKILYDVDRAIDLYALGKDDFGAPERRAAAFSYIIQSFLFTSGLVISPSTPNGDCKLPDRLFQVVVGGNPVQFRGLLIEIQGNLRHLLPPLVTSPPDADPDLVQMLNDLVDYANRVRDKLKENIINGKNLCDVPIKGSSLNICDEIHNIIDPGPPFKIPADLQGMTDLFRFAKIGEAHLLRNGVEDVPTSPPSVNAFLGILQQELCIQEDMEERWRNLVKSMAPNCFGIDKVLNAVEQVIEGAINLVSGEVCPIFQPSIPPHYETSLDAIANDVDSLGGGRDT
jgi:hypothetical protein